ncbi:MAG TPA: extracellular solute-binding protein [Clostridiaceae bacterium]
MIKKTFSIMMSVILATSFLSGCTSTKKPKSAVDNSSVMTPYGKYATTVTFSQGKSISPNPHFPAGDTYLSNLQTKYVKEKLNVTFTDSWEASGDAYNQKVSLAIASGTIPDVMIVPDRKTLKQLVDNNLVEDLTTVFDKVLNPFLKEQYASYGQRLLDQATIDGKLMAIPGTSIGGQQNLLWVRQDWLTKLGLPAPTNIADVENIAKQFIDKNPGGNAPGKTIGLAAIPALTVYNAAYGLDTIFSLYGAYPKQWMKDSSGNAYYGSVAPEMKAGLTKISDMYKNGLIDKQFAVRTLADTNALVVSGQCGILFAPWWAPYDVMTDAVKANPKADWKPFVAPLDTNGKLNFYSQDPVNGFLVVRKGYAHPEAIVKVLNVENDSLRKIDPTTLDYYKGLGVDWGCIPINLQIDYNDVLVRCYNQLKEAIDTKSDAKMRVDYKQIYADFNTNLANPGANAAIWATATTRWDGQQAVGSNLIVYHDPVFLGVTPTMETKWANLQKLESESLLKIVVGQSPVSDFDKFAQAWKDQGGDVITKEVNAAIKK